MPRPPVILEVPAGTPARTCNGRTCNAQIYFVQKAPIHCDVEGGVRPTATEKGRGVNHFGTCPDAAYFHRSKKGAR